MRLSVTDLDYIYDQTVNLWGHLYHKRLLITGGTGFLGSWLLDSLVWVNQLLNLNTRAVILTRNLVQFKKKYPHLYSEPSFSFLEGDVKDFKFPQGEFSYVIHAASDIGSSLNKNDSRIFDTIVHGTKHTLEFAKSSGAKDILFVSSGAVYGSQPSSITHIAENYPYSLMDVKGCQSEYAKGKQQAEEICSRYAEQSHLNIKIARCFSFVGPRMPLDAHFAIGNFIRNGLKRSPIMVTGNSMAYRSYLYAADLTIWLWTILFRGQTMRPYNVGSDVALTIGELAREVAGHFKPTSEIHIKPIASALPAERYVPDISRARDELGLLPGVSLAQAIQSTINWYNICTFG